MSVTKAYKPRFQHIALVLAVFGGVAFAFYYYVTADVVEAFILSQFKPEKKELLEFAGVHATPSRKGEAEHGPNVTVAKDLIDKEYFFDFTHEERSEKIHGYEKGAGEWLVRAPKLGEDAIYLEPYGFSVIALLVGALVAVLLTLVLPPSIGYCSQKIHREIYNTKAKIRLQTGFNSEIVEVLTLRDSDLERLYEQNPEFVKDAFRTVWNRTIPEEEKGANGNGAGPVSFDKSFGPDEDITIFRNQILLGRIKEILSEVIVVEIVDVQTANKYKKLSIRIFAGLRLYMAHHFSHKYSNSVTGFAYGGAAFLIIAVGIRGLKFIPATRPSLIFFAILMEFAMLSMLAVVLFYTEGEERMDKMLKKMEDASKNQLEMLNKLADDMHKFALAFEGGTSELMKKKVEEAVGEYLQSDNNVESAVAHAIRDKLVVSLKDTFSNSANSTVS